VVAVILGVLVVVGLMSTRLAHRPAVPAATPGASLMADYGPPPAGVPLLYVKDPTHPTWLIGFDWSGQPRGTLKLDPAIGSVGMAPDGQAFAVGFGSKGGTGEILDRLGQPLAIRIEDNVTGGGRSFEELKNRDHIPQRSVDRVVFRCSGAFWEKIGKHSFRDQPGPL